MTLPGKSTLKFISAGMEVSGRIEDDPYLRIMVALPSGQTRTIPLAEEEALRVIVDLAAGLAFLRRQS